MVGNKEFVPTPTLSAEQCAIYASQVIIPFTLADRNLGYIGPLVNVDDVEKTKIFFPTYHSSKPIASKPSTLKNAGEKVDKNPKGSTAENVQGKNPSKIVKVEKTFHLDCMTGYFKPFRSCPMKNSKLYLEWLAKI